MDVGSHGLTWDGPDNANHLVAAGVHYVEIEINNSSGNVRKIAYVDKQEIL
jgi:hypothetical protein